MFNKEHAFYIGTFSALLRRLEEAINICNACPEKSCRARPRIVKNLMQDKRCVFRGGQCFDIGCNGEASLDPGLNTAGERSNIFKSPPVECHGYANARRFAGARAVKNDLTIGRQIRVPVSRIAFEQVGIDSNGTRNRYQFLSVLRTALQVQDQDILLTQKTGP